MHMCVSACVRAYMCVCVYACARARAYVCPCGSSGILSLSKPGDEIRVLLASSWQADSLSLV